MKRLVLILAIGLAASGLTQADVYIKDEVRAETFFLGFLSTSELVGIEELWIGETTVSLTQSGKTLIIDFEEKRFSFIDHGSRTFVEAPLPLDLSTLLSEDLQTRYRSRRTTGVVDKTDQIQSILGRDCQEYAVNYWDESGGTISNDRKLKVWATTDVPFDWRGFQQLLLNMRKIYNRDDKLQAELAEIQGIQMRIEMSEGFFFERKLVSTVVEIAERQPSPNTYSPPQGYTETKTISLSQL